jgi:hypothetical protein
MNTPSLSPSSIRQLRRSIRREGSRRKNMVLRGKDFRQTQENEARFEREINQRRQQ